MLRRAAHTWLTYFYYILLYIWYAPVTFVGNIELDFLLEGAFYTNFNITTPGCTMGNGQTGVCPRVFQPNRGVGKSRHGRCPLVPKPSSNSITTRWQDANSPSMQSARIFFFFGRVVGASGAVAREGAQGSPFDLCTTI